MLSKKMCIWLYFYIDISINVFFLNGNDGHCHIVYCGKSNSSHTLPVDLREIFYTISCAMGSFRGKYKTCNVPVGNMQPTYGEIFEGNVKKNHYISPTFINVINKYMCE